MKTRSTYTVFTDDGAHAEMVYMGSSEREAAFRFYRAVKSAAPGVTVIMRRAGEILLRVQVLDLGPANNHN